MTFPFVPHTAPACAWLMPVLLLTVFMTTPARAGQWLRGDLHMHSLHSDGDSPVPDVLERARRVGFDFIALTDHDNNMMHRDPANAPTQWKDPEYVADDIILLYGVEWTTGRGHANVWSAEPFDYEPLWAAHRALDADAAIAAIHEVGGLFSINHPLAATCPWHYATPAEHDAMEIWNSLYSLPHRNFQVIRELWEGQLAAGRKVTGVGGSDVHYLKGSRSLTYGLGNPTTWVYAAERTRKGVIDALREGRVTISYAANANRLELEADVDGDGGFETRMGDNLEPPGARVLFRVRLTTPTTVRHGGPHAGRESRPSLQPVNVERPLPGLQGPGEPQQIVVYRNGAELQRWALQEGLREIAFSDTVSGRAHYRAELLGHPNVRGLKAALYGDGLAVTNPIYFGFEE